MRRLPLILAMIASAWLPPALAGAADKDGRFALDGGGAVPCSQFLEAQKAKAPELALFAGWIDGYFSAVNQLRPETFDITPWQTAELLLMFVGNYCSDNPKDSFGLAVNKLGAALAADRLTVFSEGMVAGHKGAVVTVYEDIVRRAHKVLVSLKYLPAGSEPAFSAEMKAALEAFQKDKKIPVTGLPDQRTLFALLVPEAKPKGR